MVFSLALNEILFGGGTQLGNIRTRTLPARTQTCRNRSTCIKILVLLRSPCVSGSRFSFLSVFFSTLPISGALCPAFALSGSQAVRHQQRVAQLMSWERAT